MVQETGKAYRQLLAELSNAITDKTLAAARDSIRLRDAVCEYVAIENTRRTPLPEVIRTIKEILRKAESDGARASDELAQQLIDWCLEFHPESSRRTAFGTGEVS